MMNITEETTLTDSKTSLFPTEINANSIEMNKLNTASSSWSLTDKKKGLKFFGRSMTSADMLNRHRQPGEKM